MADISRLVRLAVQSRLSDATNGFNAKYAAIASSYGTPAITINWAGGSNNFAWGRIPPDLIEETSPFVYPVLTISTESAQQDPIGQRIRFKQFSGTVVAVVQVHLTWDQEGITDFESWPDAVIDAAFSSINDPTIPATWGAGIAYGGDLNCTKSPVMLAGENWRRTVSFVASFKVMVPAP